MSEQEVFDALKYRVEVAKDGTRRYYNNAGELHRDEGPAVEWPDGSKGWVQNGQYHRTDGPAIERANGTKDWAQNGQRHRTDGPAIEWANGRKNWYINDVEMTEAEFNQLVMKMSEIAVFGTAVPH